MVRDDGIDHSGGFQPPISDGKADQRRQYLRNYGAIRILKVIGSSPLTLKCGDVCHLRASSLASALRF